MTNIGTTTTTAADNTAPTPPTQAYGGEQPMIVAALYRSEPVVNWSIAFMGLHNRAIGYEFWSDYVIYKTNDLEYEHCQWADMASMRVNDGYDFEAEDAGQPQILTGSETRELEDGSMTGFWDLLVFTVQDKEFWKFLEDGSVEGQCLSWGTDSLTMLKEILDWVRENPEAAQLWLNSCDVAITAADPLKQIQRAIRQGLVE